MPDADKVAVPTAGNGMETATEFAGPPTATATLQPVALSTDLLAGGAPSDTSGGEVTSSGSMTIRILRVFIENKLAVLGAGIIILMVLFCWVGPHVYWSNQINGQLALNNGLSKYGFPYGPGPGHPLGTDNAGFDILGRLMFAGQQSLLIGLAAAAVATLFGVVYGAVSGFFGGWVDAVMMRIIDVGLSIPQLLLLIVLYALFHPTRPILIFVIAGAAWLVPGRLIRAETLTLRVREYVQAVRVMGGGGRRIVLRHIIPNAVGTIVVNATFQVADAILLLAALGFLGFGLEIPYTDWGSMLNNGVSNITLGYWWTIYPAGICIVLVVVAFNFVGDALRDSLEVRLQRR